MSQKSDAHEFLAKFAFENTGNEEKAKDANEIFSLYVCPVCDGPKYLVCNKCEEVTELEIG